MSDRGFAAVPRWIVNDETISGNAKLVYLVLSSHSNENGDVYPALDRIASLAGISKSSVQRALREMRELRIVDWDQRDREHGGRTSNLYALATTRPRGQGDQGGRSQGPGGVVRVTTEVEPVNEHHVSLAADATRSESLPGLEDETVPRSRGLKPGRLDVERLATGVVRALRIDNPRARVDARALRDAQAILDDFSTTPDEALAVLTFVLADPYWSTRVTTLAAFSRAYATARKQMRISGPATVVEQLPAELIDDSLAQDGYERASLFLSRSVDPATWWDAGRDQAALLATVRRMPVVWPAGSDEHHALILGWEFRAEGQSLAGNLPAWRPVRV